MALEQELVKIKVVGVGGAGGNALNDMISGGVGGVEYIAANTDAQDLEKSLADIRIQLGEKLTRGQGAGADPEIGRLAAEEEVEKIKSLLEDTDMLFITAGMGGGTGTGAAPVIAKIAKDMGVLTMAVVTRPFSFEGKRREKNTQIGIDNLKVAVDGLVIIPNDKLFELPDKAITIQNAFKEANNILKIGITGIAELVLKSGMINLDFADIKTTLLNSGLAVLGYGEGEGENRAMKAADKALLSPLLEKSILGASKILLNISGSEDLTLMEAKSIADKITSAAGKSAEDVMFGVIQTPELKDKVQVTIIANNFINEEKNESFIDVETSKENKNTADKKINEIDFDTPAMIRRQNR